MRCFLLALTQVSLNFSLEKFNIFNDAGDLQVSLVIFFSKRFFQLHTKIFGGSFSSLVYAELALFSFENLPNPKVAVRVLLGLGGKGDCLSFM